MITITGKPVCSGVAFGPVFVFSREESTIKRHHIESSDDEIARFESARQQTISELAMLYDKEQFAVSSYKSSCTGKQKSLRCR